MSKPTIEQKVKGDRNIFTATGDIIINNIYHFFPILDKHGWVFLGISVLTIFVWGINIWLHIWSPNFQLNWKLFFQLICLPIPFLWVKFREKVQKVPWLYNFLHKSIWSCAIVLALMSPFVVCEVLPAPGGGLCKADWWYPKAYQFSRFVNFAFTIPPLSEKKGYNPQMVHVPHGWIELGGAIQQVWLNDYYIGSSKVTNQNYYEFVKAHIENPSNWIPDEWNNNSQWIIGFSQMSQKWTVKWRGNSDEGYMNHPVQVTWYQAEGYCGWLNQKTGAKYRLPTEAEWERACQSGKFNEASDQINQLEWCFDWYDENGQASGLRINPSGPPEGKKKVARRFQFNNDGKRDCTTRAALNPLNNEIVLPAFRVVR